MRSGVQTWVVSGAVPKWRVQFPQLPVSYSNSIVVSANTGGNVTLQDVAFGSVFLCSGQSNMQFTVISAYNGSEEMPAAGTYGESIRVTNLDLIYDPVTPHEDVWAGQVMLNWSRASNTSIGGAAWSYMSATCYLFARNLHDLIAGTPYARPFGLIASTWGGTEIEVWMNAQAFAATGESYSYFNNHGVPNSYPSSLWNAMINPLTNHTIDSILWYQGEANVGYSTANYSRNEPIMVSSWRSVFSSKTKTSPQVPFGFVQLAGWSNESVPVNSTQSIAEMRFAQNGGVNFAVPNAALGPSFRANAFDLADPVTPVNPPPYGDIHPRYKEQVGYRLAVAALPVLFPGASGARIAPYFSNCSVGQSSITASFTNGGGSVNLFWNSKAWIPGFDLRDSTNTWYNTTITAVAGNSVSVAIPTGAVRPITGIRYAWQQNPCCPVWVYSTPGACPIQNCALYDGSDVNRLPVNPFTADVVASSGSNACALPAHPFSY